MKENFSEIKDLGRLRKFGKEEWEPMALKTYFEKPDGGALELPLMESKGSALARVNPEFFKPQTRFDWSICFLQKDGRDLSEQTPTLAGVFNITALHNDKRQGN